jgi:hypothetical protein
VDLRSLPTDALKRRLSGYGRATHEAELVVEQHAGGWRAAFKRVEEFGDVTPTVGVQSVEGAESASEALEQLWLFVESTEEFERWKRHQVG